MSDATLRPLTKSEIAARSQRLERITREIGERRSTIGRDIWEIGIRLEEVQRLKLWRAGRYSSFDDYLLRGAKISGRSARRFVRIAGHFSGEVAKLYGVEKLDAILRWEQATPASELPGDLGAAQIRLRDGRGRFYKKPLHEAAPAEILEAIGLIEQAKRGRHPIPTSMRKRAERLSEALPPPPPGVRAAQRVRITRGKGGAYALSFSAIPIDAIGEFLRLVEEQFGGE
jgi:hypothetical protein